MLKGKRIAVNTGGGDAPGLNAVIEAVVMAAHCRNWEVFGTMVALDPPNVKAVPLDQVIGSIKNMPLESDTIQTARDVGICFGD